MPELVSPIKYLREKLDINGDFLQEWRKLDNEDKEQLKQRAKEEMEQERIKNLLMAETNKGNADDS
jgi:mRNA-degrading endonuclease RelE of RelBE toxin-antitoxin system